MSNKNTHNHSHNNSHSHLDENPISIQDKISKLLDHWLKHNNDHISNYHKWAETARTNQMDEVGSIIDEIADMSIKMNGLFESAIEKIQSY